MSAQPALYGHIRRNAARSVAMFAGFVVAVELLAFALVGPVTLLMFAISRDMGGDPGSAFWAMRWYFIGAPVIAAAFFLHNVRLAAARAGSATQMRLVERAQERRFVDLLEETAIANGLLAPRAAVIETPALNAFVCGLSQRDATVAVTRGLLLALDDEELEATLANRLAQVRLGDIRLTACAHTALHAVLSLEAAYLPRVRVWWLIPSLLFPPLFVMLIGVLIFGAVARMIAYLARLLITRAREFVADGVAVEATKNPAALISALEKIGGRSALPGLPATMQAMLIDGPSSGGLASHPAIGERIAALRLHTGALSEAMRPRKDTRESAAGGLSPVLSASRPGMAGQRGSAAPVSGLHAARAVLRSARQGERGKPPPSAWSQMSHLTRLKHFAVAAALYALLIFGGPYLPESVQRALGIATHSALPAQTTK